MMLNRNVKALWWHYKTKMMKFSKKMRKNLLVIEISEKSIINSKKPMKKTSENPGCLRN